MASLRSADTAKIRNNIGLLLVDGVLECSGAAAATQEVSGRLNCERAKGCGTCPSRRRLLSTPPAGGMFPNGHRKLNNEGEYFD
jgi:hypothetical protein